MSNGKITGGLVAIVIIVFSVFFITQNLVLDRGNRLEHDLDLLSVSARQGDWKQAEAAFERFTSVWNEGKYLVALNNAEQNYSNVERQLHVLRGAVRGKDADTAMQTALEIKGDWQNFKKIVPGP